MIGGIRYRVIATGAGNYALKRVLSNDYAFDVSHVDEREAILAWQTAETKRISTIARRLLARQIAGNARRRSEARRNG